MLDHLVHWLSMSNSTVCIHSSVVHCNVSNTLRKIGLEIAQQVGCFNRIVGLQPLPRKYGSQCFHRRMMCSPFSYLKLQDHNLRMSTILIVVLVSWIYLMALLKSAYRKHVRRKDRWYAKKGSLVSTGATVLETRALAVLFSHSLLLSWGIGWSGLLIPNTSQMLAVRWALKLCIRNSSPTLKTLTPLSTFTRFTTCLKLPIEPVWELLPQYVRTITRRHSHKKWKSPVIK